MITLTRMRQDHTVAAADEAKGLAAIAAATAMWEHHTHSLWAARTGHVERVRPGGGTVRSLFLRLAPVTAVTTVRVRGSWDGSTEVLAGSSFETLTADEDFLFIDPRELLITQGSWAPIVEVTYNGGYAADDGPADVLRVIATQAAYLMQRLGGEQLTAATKGFEGGSSVYLSAEVHPAFKALAQRMMRKA